MAKVESKEHGKGSFNTPYTEVTLSDGRTGRGYGGSRHENTTKAVKEANSKSTTKKK